jgi:hypothetical protein
LVRQARLDKVTDREGKEKAFEPIMEQLDKVEKAVKQTDEDLSKKLEQIPINKKTESSPEIKKK